MENKLRVLLIEDSDDDAALIIRALKQGGYDPEHLRVDNAIELQQALPQNSWDLAISDYSMPGFNGLEALELVRATAPELPFILVSGAVGEETATEIMRHGARDYVMKDKLARLVPAIQRELAEVAERRRQREREKLLQSQLNQAQKMEAIGALAGGVAHDFNNILTVVKGYAELGLLRLQESQPGHEEFAGILEAAQRSTDLTRQLLAFARKQTANPIVLDLNETVTGMLKMLRRLIGEEIELDWQPAADLWPVKMDPGQVDQVLANLCINARDAISYEGRISIATANVVLNDQYCTTHASCLPGEYVLLTVSDNGAGMDRETQTHIFEPFFTTKETGKGTGLGLATVYGIIKQNQGFINFYSEPGQGSTFRIYLPCHRAAEQETPPPDKSPETLTGGGETILLVEDDPTILTVTTKILQELGYRILAAATPREALTLAQQQHDLPDLLLSDVVMPEINGRELAEKIRASRPDIRCLFMSGYPAEVIAHNGMLEEGINFLQKPFSMQDLASKIRIALDAP
ncbi:hybrid sensor histidine kinase/response regulator [Desulfurivibrio alkaliphilus]|uniref:histidine kinase n=1 Tax=Desulfurivibrio alkaliphilus (strain DSM 19089 / UNIQEM U267 / AHT2) TaxID=589865 RepID=D6Z3D4_DESAT|nr:hybrid sensor histidine kinase/response regulator [Desulfurivibrio alkaliphilus]ADH86059.1 histidine kinase [Desulfurivibrio alkaliphilus AHT 2]